MAALAAVPSFAPASFSNASSGQSHQSPSRASQMPRNLYSSAVTGLPPQNYRGNSPSAIAPYAFTSTPTLSNPHQQPLYLRPENRALSTSQAQQLNTNVNAPRNRFPQNPSIQALPPASSNNIFLGQMSRDDMSVPLQRAPINQTRASPVSSSSNPSPALNNGASSSKPSPDRYRRNHRRAEMVGPNGSNGLGSAPPSGSGMATVGHLYKHPNRANSSPSLHSFNSSTGPAPMLNRPQSVGPNFGSFQQYAPQMRPTSADDMQMYRQPALSHAQLDKYRRKSISSLDAGEITAGRVDLGPVVMPSIRPLSKPTDENPRNLAGPQRPKSSHGHSGSSESIRSVRSVNEQPPSIKNQPMTYAAALQSNSTPKQESNSVNIPPRGSSNEASKRLASPSPLSRPATVGHDGTNIAKQATQTSSFTASPAVQTKLDSPAAQQLAALNERDPKKGVKSRLRRAFSFGSAAELRRASAENNMNNASAERARLRKDRYQNEEEAEEAAVVQQQEAGGIGESIYSGQGHFFTGSTDNLSISSTASSASVMIRKMGHGMKKSTRSLVGLFRPKSIIGEQGDSAVQGSSLAQVSMVTVEAEREKVNVNANPHDQVGGGTGFPKLERNSIDAAHATANEHRGASRDGSDSHSRRSIVGGEKERAEVLAAVKKGILKRSGTDSSNSSPVQRPVDSKSPDFNLPQIPHVSDTPGSSGPSTPRDDRPTLGHRRTDSVTIEGEDYFMGLPKLNGSGESKSLPVTPQNMAKYNVSFSPRLQFHDTWPSLEYDRRGEIATCNRLTPMLAQQIKEELNTFKMEMEVHEQSKVYTHFF